MRHFSEDEDNELDLEMTPLYELVSLEGAPIRDGLRAKHAFKGRGGIYFVWDSKDSTRCFVMRLHPSGQPRISGTLEVVAQFDPEDGDRPEYGAIESSYLANRCARRLAFTAPAARGT